MPQNKTRLIIALHSHLKQSIFALICLIRTHYEARTIPSTSARTLNILTILANLRLLVRRQFRILIPSVGESASLLRALVVFPAHSPDTNQVLMLANFACILSVTRQSAHATSQTFDYLSFWRASQGHDDVSEKQLKAIQYNDNSSQISYSNVRFFEL